MQGNHPNDLQLSSGRTYIARRQVDRTPIRTHLASAEERR